MKRLLGENNAVSDSFLTSNKKELKTIGKTSVKIGPLRNVETFPFVYSSVSRTYMTSNVNNPMRYGAMVTIPK